ncbi:hypothetical protein [Enhydrobacter sp.]|jgi:hypothetical protein|uniref:hypothetical protein n=1 Tax=Enhydrobacter sp. TaxID=1894999 RepID=UPI0026351A30|nr:hypothetical protein [Enhydrobacter sp.]WIM10143.1 MAG: hypothetical protein OJF58_001097 [Enhydrobacter sp.]
MNVVNTPIYTKIKSAPDGSLVFLASAPETFGVIIGRDGDNRVFGCVSSKDPKELGRHWPLMPDTACFSFGTEWLVETDLSKGVSSSIDDAGVLLLGPHGPEFRFRSTKAGGDVLIFNTAGKVSNPGDLVALKGWRIWASLDARNQRGICPLIDRS